MAELRVDIASEFTGKKAFDKAAKATSSLDKAVSKLGRQLVSVFAVTKIVAFGKASVKAFLDDEAAATRLGKAVENLGLAFAQPQIDNYISKLEASSSVADDLLRPAFQSLLTTTGSLTKSQELLSLAIEASRGSGVELSTVAQDLASAFVGNTKGLRKYNLGLTQAELKTMSFTDVQEKFNQQFSGASQAFLSTYAGQLNILAVAAGNAQEVIGKGLVDALVLAGGKDGDIQNVSDAMAGLAEYTADSIRGIGVLVSKINALDQALTGGALGKLLKFNSTLGFTGLLSRLGNEAQERPKAGRRFMGGQQANLYSSEEAAQKKLARQQAELTKKQIAAQKKLTDEQKKQALLKKAGSIFDLEQVQLIAALKGKLSDEDRKRVELQFALITGNTKEAQLLTFEIAKAQGLSTQLAGYLASLPDARNPFTAWADYLDEIAKKAAKAAMITPAFGSTGALGNPNFETGTTAQIVAELDKSTAYVLQLAKETDALVASIAASSAANPAAVTALKSISPSSSKHVIENFGGYGSSRVAAGSVIVQIDGKAVASALQNSSLSGIGSSVNRTGR